MLLERCQLKGRVGRTLYSVKRVQCCRQGPQMNKEFTRIPATGLADESGD